MPASAVTRSRSRTTDPEVAERLMRVSYDTLRMGRLPKRGDFLFEQDIHADDNLAMAHWRFSGALHFAGSAREVLTLVHVLSGTSDWRIGSVTGHNSAAALVHPGDYCSGTAEDLEILIVTLDLNAVTDVARSLYNDDGVRLRFLDHEASSPALARLVRETALLAQSVVTDPGAFDSALLRASLFRHLAVTVLESFPLAGDRIQRRESAAALIAAYQRAVDFIEGHASLPITLDDIATAARVTPPELTRAFRSHAPVELDAAGYLQRVRLARAHAELEKADPDRGGTLRDIARRWGFTSAAELNRLHKEAYGISAQRTVRR